MKLEGRVAIVTGAASGMGEASAQLFAAEGAAVAVVDLTEEKAASTVERIRSSGGTAIAVGADVSNAEDVRRLATRTVDELGFPDILFNNAGIDLENKVRLLDVDDDTWDRVVSVNLRAPFLAIKHIAPLMIDSRRGGSIINTASIGAFVVAGTAGYCASKAGLMALTRVAAVELGRYRIRVNALCPGATWTGMAETQSAALQMQGIDTPDVATLAEQYSVLGRIASPDDMARMALFLASDDSSYATGAAFVNDGGMSINVGVRTHEKAAGHVA